MRCTTTSPCLFGGALFAAGLHASTALGMPMLTFGTGYSYGEIVATGPMASYMLSYGGPGPSPFADGAYAGGGMEASFDASRTELAIVHDRTDSATFDFSRVAIVAYLQVTEECIGRVMWDFGGWEGSNQAQVVNLSTVSVVIDDAGATVGNRTAVLTPGTQYGVFLVTQGGAAGGQSSARFAVEPLNGCNDADINKDGVLSLDDLEAFVEAFLFGCP